MALGGERAGALGDHARHYRLGGGAGERRVAREHLVEHRAQGVDVGAGGDLALAHRLLGAHVVRRAERHAGLGHPAPAGLAGRERDAEVGDQRLAVVQQDVLGLDVAVDHAVAVGVVERRGHFGRDPDRVGDRELLLAGEPVAQGLALDVGHDVEEVAVGLARVEQGQDVGVLEVGRQLDLGQEPLGADHGRQLGAEDLHGHRPVVADVLGEVDGGHAAGAGFAVETVAVREGGLEAAEEFGHGAYVWGTEEDGGGEGVWLGWVRAGGSGAGAWHSRSLLSPDFLDALPSCLRTALVGVLSHARRTLGSGLPRGKATCGGPLAEMVQTDILNYLRYRVTISACLSSTHACPLVLLDRACRTCYPSQFSLTHGSCLTPAGNALSAFPRLAPGCHTPG